MAAIKRFRSVAAIVLWAAVFLLLLLNSAEHQADAKPLLSDLFNRVFGSSSSSSSDSYSAGDRSIPLSSGYYRSGEVITSVREASSRNGAVEPPVNYTYPRIWLTVASAVDVDAKTATTSDPKNSSVVRALELHWSAGPAGPKVGDFLELYYFDPTKMTGAQTTPRPVRRYLLRDDQNRTMSSYIRTDVEFPYMNTSTLDSLVQASHEPHPYRTQHGLISGRCLHYYLVYLEGNGGGSIGRDPSSSGSSNNNHPKAINCIQMNGRWMEAAFEYISNRTLAEVMLPGTHDATSYEHYKASDYETNVISRFQFTQDESLYAQLSYGIRYLDMRVGAYNLTEDELMAFATGAVSGSSSSTPSFRTQSTRSPAAYFQEELWMVHNMQRNHISLVEALKQVKRFLERTTHEVVVVDFHRFVNGFDQVDDSFAVAARLRNFYKIVVEQLGPFLIPYSTNRHSTIGQLVREGKRVVLGYAYKNKGLFDSDLFWPAVEHLWANSDQLEKLEKYLDEKVCSGSPGSSSSSSIHLRSAMAELTPSIEGIIFLKYHGLRELAQLTNAHYDGWFRRRWWRCANIVAGDFFLGSDLVQIAVDVNRRRFTNDSAPYQRGILVHN